MIFHERFEISTLACSVDEVALSGREIASNRPVVCHLLAVGSLVENRVVARQAASVAQEHGIQVFDAGELDGLPYVIMGELPGSPSLFSWLASLRKDEPEPDDDRLQRGMWRVWTDVPHEAPREPARAVPAAPDPGEFTMLLRQVPVAVAPSEAGLQAEPAAAKPPKPEPALGEFTQILHASQGPDELPTAAMERPQDLVVESAEVAPPAQPAAAEPGEFTRMLEKPGELVPAAPAREASRKNPVAAPAAEPAIGPGEFTRMMQSPLAPGAPPPQAIPMAAQPPTEFSRILQGGGDFPAAVSRPREPAAAPASALAQPAQEGEFTRLFAAPVIDDRAARPADPLPLPGGGLATGAFSRAASPGLSGAGAGPSEFTKIIAIPQQSPPAPKTPAAAASASPVSAAAAKAKKSILPLILGLGLLLLAALTVLVIVAVKR